MATLALQLGCLPVPPADYYGRPQIVDRPNAEEPKPRDHMARLVIDTAPPGARVRLDPEPPLWAASLQPALHRPTPLAMEVPQGPHDILVQMWGRSSLLMHLNVEASTTELVQLELPKVYPLAERPLGLWLMLGLALPPALVSTYFAAFEGKEENVWIAVATGIITAGAVHGLWTRYNADPPVVLRHEKYYALPSESQ